MSFNNIRVGYAKADITPKAGCWLSGFGFRDKPSLGIHTRLYARTVFFKGDGGVFALTSCDVLAISFEMKKRILQKTENLGLSHECYFISATHTHSGPVTIRLDQDKVGKRWMDYFVERVAYLIKEAAGKLKEADFAIGRSLLKGVAVNRHTFDKDGKVHFVPDKVNLEGAIDDEVNTIWIRKKNSREIICIANFSCHPISLAKKTVRDAYLISADFPGIASRLLSKEKIELVHLSGSLGNINPVYICGGKAKCERLGIRYVTVIKKQIPGLKYHHLEKFHFYSHSFNLKTEKPFSKDKLLLMRKSQQSIIDSPEERSFEEIFHASAAVRYCDYFLDKHNKGEKIPDYRKVIIQAIKMGDGIIIGHPFELFIEVTLQLKKEFPQYIILPTGLANDRLGYLATKKAYSEGGYEVERAYLSDFSPAPFKPDTEDIILDNMVKAVERVRG